MKRFHNQTGLAFATSFVIGLTAASVALAAGKDHMGSARVNQSITQGLGTAQSFGRSPHVQQSFGANTATGGLTNKSTTMSRFGSVPSTTGSGFTSGSSTISGNARRLQTTGGTGTFNGTVGTFNGASQLNGSQLNASQINKFKQQLTPSGITTTTGGLSTTIRKLPSETKVKLPTTGTSLPTGAATTASGTVKTAVTNQLSPATLGTITSPLVPINTKPKTAACIPPICPPHCPPHCPPFWPFPLRPIVVITPPIVILPAPVIVVSKTIIVAGKPAAVARAIDLELVGLQLVDAGSVDEQIGPRYRIWTRNNGSTALHTEFKVAILAAEGEEPKPESPHVAGRVSAIEAGQTLAIDLRLPVTANDLGRDAQGNPIPFSKLFVWIDSLQEIKESNENNNATMMARGEIPLAELPAAKAEAQAKP